MKKINEVLSERGSNYGSFHTFSNLSQTLYAIIVKHYNDVNQQRGEEAQLPAFMAESLRMICHKLARIANGNPYHLDSWVDIGGYSQLVAQIIEETNAIAAATAAELEVPKEAKPPASVTPLTQPQVIVEQGE